MNLEALHAESAERIGFTQLAAGEWADLPVERKIVLAYVKCVGRWGMSKTTMADVAAVAGCSRATVYRLVPGGTEALEEASRVDQVGELMNHLLASVDTSATVTDMCIDTVHLAALAMASNETLAYLLRHEPEALEPHLSFKSNDAVIDACVFHFSPVFASRMEPAAAMRLIEHLGRVVLSYVQAPSRSIDLTDRPSVERLLRHLVLPAHLDSTELNRPTASINTQE